MVVAMGTLPVLTSWRKAIALLVIAAVAAGVLVWLAPAACRDCGFGSVPVRLALRPWHRT